MATNSQPQETPEYRTFREHYNRLYHAIQDPLSLATKLFAKSIITSAVIGRVIAMGLSTLEKNGVLLSAVDSNWPEDILWVSVGFERRPFNEVIGEKYASYDFT